MMNLFLMSQHVAVKLRTRLMDKKGASMVEYAILLGGVAAAAIVAVNLLGPQITTSFQNVSNGMTAGS